MIQKIEVPKSTAQQLGSIVKSCRDIMRKDKGLNGDLDRLPMLTWIMFLKFLDDMEELRKEEANLAGKRFRPAMEAPYRWRDWASKPDGMTGPELIVFINQAPGKLKSHSCTAAGRISATRSVPHRGRI